MDDGKGFWSMVSKVYETSVLAGERSKEASGEMAEEILKYLEPDMTVLELAAGQGVLSRKIAPHCKTLIATDCSSDMVKTACKKKIPNNCIYLQQDATNLLFTNGRFDAVVIANALHVMPHPEKALNEVLRVLKPDGILLAPIFIREEDKCYPAEVLMQQIGLKPCYRWTEEEYKAFVKDQGFRVTRSHIITGHNYSLCFVSARKELT